MEIQCSQSCCSQAGNSEFYLHPNGSEIQQWHGKRFCARVNYKSNEQQLVQTHSQRHKLSIKNSPTPFVISHEWITNRCSRVEGQRSKNAHKTGESKPHWWEPTAREENWPCETHLQNLTASLVQITVSLLCVTSKILNRAQNCLYRTQLCFYRYPSRHITLLCDCIRSSNDQTNYKNRHFSRKYNNVMLKWESAWLWACSLLVVLGLGLIFFINQYRPALLK